MAYMRNLPCLNPHCGSHGQPHPNCKCYGFAEGGEIGDGGAFGSYCLSNAPHKPGCQYYKDGGDVLQPTPPGSDIEGDVAAALAHGGANLLFGNGKSPYFSAFGSGTTAPSRLALAKGQGLEANVSSHLKRIKKGHSALKDNVEALFKGGKVEIPDYDKDSIKDYVAKGGVDADLQNTTGQEDPLSSVFPQHNLILNTAKARVSNYLNSIRPQELQMKLPFDANKSTKDQEREYDRATQLAASPMSVLSEIKDGSLTPQHVKHFTSMWPEVHTHLSKKLTEEITKAQLDNRRPKYKARQAMSMFMGTALDSTMTPANIMAAQNVFAQKQAAQQGAGQPPKQKKGTAPLSKVADNYQTQEQAAQARNKQ